MHRCKQCGYKWQGRKLRSLRKLPKVCPKCHTTKWNGTTNQYGQTPLEYEDITNSGGVEWNGCMYFDDESAVPAGCAEYGQNLATIEVPLGTVDVTWRNRATHGYQATTTRPAAHPSERGCYTTMPLVLCEKHLYKLTSRFVKDVLPRQEVIA